MHDKQIIKNFIAECKKKNKLTNNFLKLNITMFLIFRYKKFKLIINFLLTSESPQTYLFLIFVNISIKDFFSRKLWKNIFYN